MAVIAGERAKNTKTSHLKNEKIFHTKHSDLKGVHQTKFFFLHINQKNFGTLKGSRQ